MLKSPSLQRQTDGWTERTLTELEEIASKTVHEDEESDK